MGSMIATMSMMIWVFVVAVIVFTTVKRVKRMPGKKAIDDRFYASTEQIYSSGRKNAGRSGSNIRVSSKNTDDGMILKDDRNNDWLAMQLREEARARIRVSDMFQMKLEHSNKCEAEFIRRFHESNCDANGIDTGIAKSTKKSANKSTN